LESLFKELRGFKKYFGVYDTEQNRYEYTQDSIHRIRPASGAEFVKLNICSSIQDIHSASQNPKVFVPARVIMAELGTTLSVQPKALYEEIIRSFQAR
jgi:hypothetical protein